MTSTLTVDIREFAVDYCRRGWPPIPVPYRFKKPTIVGYPDLRITEETVPDHFPSERGNVGVLLGEPAGGLVDIDLDCAEAERAADLLLPPTGCIFGRRGKPRSHWLYIVEAPIASDTFKDVNLAMLLELRSTNRQTIFPGSTHPEGSLIQWAEDDEPARIQAEELLKAVKRLAAVAIIARHWPDQGSRQEAALALAGGFLRV